MTGTTTSVGTAVPASSLARVTEIAFNDGLAAALGSIPPGPEVLWASTSGWSLVPTGAAGSRPEHQSGDIITAAGTLVALEGLTLVRRAQTPAAGKPVSSLYLIALRIGLTRRMLGLAIEYLRGRMSDGRPLIQRQLVQGSVAKIATAVEICSQAITAVPDETDAPVPTGWMHDRLDRADSLVVAMFGATGFLLDHPARCLHVVALLRDLWDPGGQGDPPW